MNHNNQPKYFIIDFDSTFIKVEALDELAKIIISKNPNQLHTTNLIKEVEKLTNTGMSGELSITDSLKKRLQLIKPHKNDITPLIEILKKQVSKSFKDNGQFLKEYADYIYIVSNGFIEYITPVVTIYGIHKSHIFANTFIYDGNDNIIGLDETNILSKPQGKAHCVQSLKLQGEILVIGDGYSDYEIKELECADKFYAFTENVTRESVIKLTPYIAPNLDEVLYQNKLPANISYPKNRIKILLLENIHETAINILKQDGYSVETISSALNEDELIEKIKGVSVLGIRSKTLVTKKVLEHADKLMIIGAFCIGTNQIDITSASEHGICVFNAPYSNTRSVVELVIGEIIMLMRKIMPKNYKLHNGIWDKSADNSFEIRGKILGIIGYGNIGSQLSVLAESMGMQVYYYDLMECLPMGNAKKCHSINELLEISDIVTLHVDGRADNKNIIGDNELTRMKHNAILINLSRGHVIDIDALIRHIKNGKFLGVGLDVYPSEPKNNQEEFVSELREFDNVILTPHIGGSTIEAQYNIGEFVANRIINYLNLGDTTQSINLPNMQLPNLKDAHRLIHIHKNTPGVIAQINQIFAKHNINVLWQSLRTSENIGYIITDINKHFDTALIDELKNITHTIKFRVLY